MLKVFNCKRFSISWSEQAVRRDLLGKNARLFEQ